VELEEQLDSYVMLYKHYGLETPWETQLSVYIHHASLSPKQQGILNEANRLFWNLEIEAEAYQKPLRLRSSALEYPLAHCGPPDEEFPDGLDPDDIPF
jgi:hypothetical protein